MGKRTRARPYISDNGARKGGPTANDKRKILKVIAVIDGFVMPYFMATSGKPGAMMELPNGVMKVYNETWQKSAMWADRGKLTDE